MPFTGLGKPADVTLDRSGDVFVTDTGNNRVVELTPADAQTTLPFSGLFLWFGGDGVAVDGSGDVFVADAFNNRVVELTAGGAQITLPFSELKGPASVAVDGSGVANFAGASGDVGADARIHANHKRAGRRPRESSTARALRRTVAIRPIGGLLSLPGCTREHARRFRRAA